MSARGTKRRGRPPKSVVMERPRKFQMHMLKKPKYLLNRESKGSETPNSQTSTPTASRASSPVGSESSRRSIRPRGRDRYRRGTGYQRRGYNPDAVDEKDSEYHYGSDFGDESNSGKSDIEEEPFPSESDFDEDSGDGPSSDSDFSLSSYSTASGIQRRSVVGRPAPPSPVPLWLQNKDFPPLELPKSSDDLLVPRDLVLQALGVYEVLRRFRTLARLSPFRFEDFCAALVSEEQTPLLSECHLSLLKALLREEDAQQTHFGPLDHRDSVNVTLYAGCDTFAWPEVLRAYVESDPTELDPTGELLRILGGPTGSPGGLDKCRSIISKSNGGRPVGVSEGEYPFGSAEDRLKVLTFLTDQFLITNPVREDLLNEGNIHYDDHCRICHRLGDLLCCETCPAVFHLECVQPPLEDVPEEDWQCSVCKAHQVPGVTDCISEVEKSGLLCRQEHLGYDRHGRKYWFLARRIFVESEDGEVWYYSSRAQLNELKQGLDPREFEAPLVRELGDLGEELERQMAITERLTQQLKGSKRSYLDAESAALAKQHKEKEERRRREESGELDDIGAGDGQDGRKDNGQKQEEEAAENEAMEDDEEEKEDADEDDDGDDDDGNTASSSDPNSAAAGGNDENETSVGATPDSREGQGATEQEKGDAAGAGRKKKKATMIVTRSKTGSLTPRTFSMDDLKRRPSSSMSGVPTSGTIHGLPPPASPTPDSEGSEALTRMTRLKAQQIASGTYLFKLGMESGAIPSSNSGSGPGISVSGLGCRLYVNQYAVNPGASLNKPQRNEERDKKRHLSHKFSLTSASEFKWLGTLYGSRTALVAALRQTLLALEQALQAPFLHVNWPLLRRPWVTSVSASSAPRDFSRALVVLQTCIKPVVFSSVWHEALGHIRLQRLTASEREERKRQEKKDKKEKEEEEERNRMTYHFVKYTLGLRHQVWKQKGEEYRIHGQWGWLWLSATRRLKMSNCKFLGHSGGPHQMMVQVKDDKGVKVLAVDPNTYRKLKHKIRAEEEAATVVEGSDMVVEGEEVVESTVKTEPQSLDDVKPDEVKEGEVVVKKEVDLDSPVKEEVVKASESPLSSSLQNLKVFPPVDKLDNLDVSRALIAPGRLLYPKVARKCKIDELLVRRTQLKVVEERRLALSKGLAEAAALKAKQEKESGNADVEGKEGSEKDPTQPVAVQRAIPGGLSKEVITQINRRVLILKTQLSKMNEMAKKNPCYSTYCQVDLPTPESVQYSPFCYSPLCRRRFRTKNDVVRLLKFLNHAEQRPQAAANHVAKLQQDTAKAVVKEAPQEPVTDSSAPSVSAPAAVPIKTEPPAAPAESANIDVTSTPPASEGTSAMKIKEENEKPTVSPPSEIGRRSLSLRRRGLGSSRREIKEEPNPDGRIYSSDNTRAKIYLRKVVVQSAPSSGGQAAASASGAGKAAGAASALPTTTTATTTASPTTPTTTTANTTIVNGVEKSNASAVGRPPNSVNAKKRVPVKYPLVSNFMAKSGRKISSTIMRKRSVLILPKHEQRRLARKGGGHFVPGFHSAAKANLQVWPYPCPRPLFKTCWLFKTSCAPSLAAAALQLKILWACLRWDDMQVKGPSGDGKHQVTTDTEITSTELLRHRHVGAFLEKTQYLRRKVTIPLELPKAVRVTSHRLGLRKRKRAESPQSTEPQVTEEWVDEERLELWEIKQYGERRERANAHVVTRSRTGSLAPKPDRLDPGQQGASGTGNATAGVVSSKASAEEIKERLEQQLRMQRAAHQQRRALERGVTPGTQVFKVVPGGVSSQGKIVVADGLRTVTKVAIPPTPSQSGGASGTKALLAAATGQQASKAQVGQRRIFVARSPDGTTRVIHGGPTSILPKATGQTPGTPVAAGGQSLVKIRPAGPTQPQVQPGQQVPQRVHITRGPDGKIQIRGLLPGQQLLQFPDGKLHIQTGPQVQQLLIPQAQPAASPTSQATSQQPANAGVTTSTVVTRPGGLPMVTMVASTGGTPVAVKAAKSPVKLGAKANVPVAPAPAPTTVVSSQQVVIGQPTAGTTTSQVVLSGGQVLSGPTQLLQTAGGQIVVSSAALAQQLASGKAQLATIGGQQVIIRSAPPGTAVPTSPNSSAVVRQGVLVKTVAAPSAGSGNPPGAAPLTKQPAEAPPAPPAVVSTADKSPVGKVPTPPSSPKSPVKIVQAPAPTTPTTTTSTVTTPTVAAPPGTVYQPATAQVVQTPQGPRIVLQGLARTDLSQQQMAQLQMQVKQQLFKAHGNKPGQPVGPTKIFLAMQPPPGGAAPSTPAPTPPAGEVAVASAPPGSKGGTVTTARVVGTTATGQLLVVNGANTPGVVAKTVRAPGDAAQPAAPAVAAGATSPNKFVLTPDYIQQTIKSALKQENLNPEIEEKLIQLQRYQERQMKQDKIRPSGPPTPAVSSTTAPPLPRRPARKRPQVTKDDDDDDDEEDDDEDEPDDGGNDDEDWESPPPPRKRSAPRQEPRPIQRAEPPKKEEPKPPAVSAPGPTVPVSAPPTLTPVNRLVTANQAALPTPPPTLVAETPVSTTSTTPAAATAQSGGRSRTGKWRESQEERRRQAVATRLQVLLFRHRELLKKDILKKRMLLEKELTLDIQKDVAGELAARTRAERNKQEEVRGMGSSQQAERMHAQSGGARGESYERGHKRRATGSSATPVSPPESKESPSAASKSSHQGAGQQARAGKRRRGSGSERATERRESSQNPPTPRSSSRKEKLYCVCRTPYDETKFYVGCDLCNNWFHGTCVGISEEDSKRMTEFVCGECRHARDTRELYCLCKQPYDESQFYICCDGCQDWFHGRCVGILQSEADGIDEYVCPSCEASSDMNTANMRPLTAKDFEPLRKLMKQMQTHKCAWPFMEPVDPTEAPDYYKVIREPMDLQTIELRINERSYDRLSEFIGDMTKIFDNCRYYNPRESPFYRCAETLESYFAARLKVLREKLLENSK
ncbi:nucleosome-remodeling factor subunit NURF301 isoform X3 [Ischnura elegans]|uniref:nucleosome-remodeling factor subunit NURF301 isoform X3 n=1 Tax=Ischnura elegans TaxID=197161 RepID=UPI001ED8704F|nr:nucleosome-remodeling factor subunit NURF301 isoform X3 [Ischnura elegans]